MLSRIDRFLEKLSDIQRSVARTGNKSLKVLWIALTLILVYLILTIKPINDFDTVREACPNQLIEARAEQSFWGKSTEIKFYCR